MVKKKAFQIKSKEDAKYLAKAIKLSTIDFYYFLPLMGISGGTITIHCSNDTSKCKVFSSGSSWQHDEGKTIPDIVEYLWKERKSINVELRHPDSEWYTKFSR